MFFVHSENALIRAKEMDALPLKLIDVPESGDESDSMVISAIAYAIQRLLLMN